jgi:hypothetical protein
MLGIGDPNRVDAASFPVWRQPSRQHYLGRRKAMIRLSPIYAANSGIERNWLLAGQNP